MSKSTAPAHKNQRAPRAHGPVLAGHLGCLGTAIESQMFKITAPAHGNEESSRVPRHISDSILEQMFKITAPAHRNEVSSGAHKT